MLLESAGSTATPSRYSLDPGLLADHVAPPSVDFCKIPGIVPNWVAYRLREFDGSIARLPNPPPRICDQLAPPSVVLNKPPPRPAYTTPLLELSTVMNKT